VLSWLGLVHSLRPFPASLRIGSLQDSDGGRP
jgi:hypothetical protein